MPFRAPVTQLDWLHHRLIKQLGPTEHYLAELLFGLGRPTLGPSSARPKFWQPISGRIVDHLGPLHRWALNLFGRCLGPTPDRKSPSQLVNVLANLIHCCNFLISLVLANIQFDYVIISLIKLLDKLE